MVLHSPIPCSLFVQIKHIVKVVLYQGKPLYVQIFIRYNCFEVLVNLLLGKLRILGCINWSQTNMHLYKEHSLILGLQSQFLLCSKMVLEFILFILLCFSSKNKKKKHTIFPFFFRIGKIYGSCGFLSKVNIQHS